MADVRPFRGLRYAQNKVDVGLALAPPYDVIDAATQQALYDRSPHNVIRLEYPQQKAEPTVSLFGDWLSSGILQREETLTFYLHEQRFPVMDEERSRVGLIAAVCLHRPEERIILPHEHTTPKPVEDRLNILRGLRCNVSPIFGLYNDREGEVAGVMRSVLVGEPVLDAGADGQRHRLWAITSAEQQEALKHLFADRLIYLADGHHRFQAASAYRNERQGEAVGAEEGHLGNQAWQFVLMHLVALEDQGLVVLPLHRLLKNLSAEQERLFAETDDFAVEPLSLPADPDASARAIVGRLAAHDERGPSFVLVRRNGEASVLTANVEQGLGGARSRPTLDVVLLHRLLVDRVMGSPEAATDRGDLAYTPWAGEAVQQVRSGEYQVAVLQNPVPVRRIAELAEQGEQMPPKSTYFYPKLPTGLVLKRAGDGPL